MRLNGGLLSHSDSEWLAANKKALAEFNKELEESLSKLRNKNICLIQAEELAEALKYNVLIKKKIKKVSKKVDSH